MRTKAICYLLMIYLCFLCLGCTKNPATRQTADLLVRTPSLDRFTTGPTDETLPTILERTPTASESQTNSTDNPAIQEPIPTQRLISPTQISTYSFLNETNLRPTILGEVTIAPATMLAMENLGADIFLIQVSDGMERLLFQDRSWTHFVKWQDEGCKLIVNENGNLLLVDLDGNIVQELFEYGQLRAIKQEPYGHEVFLSPNNQWVWYWQASGRPYDEMGEITKAEFQDIKVISIDLKDGPYRISSNNGGWIADWSPDSQQIAFSDYDNQHILQVFVSTKQGETKKQLTSFDQPSSFDSPGTDIQQIKWSPDGKLLSINYSKIVNDKQDYATITIDVEKSETRMHLDDARLLWWADDHTIVTWIGTVGAEGIYVIDEHNLDIIGRILDAEFPRAIQIHPFMHPKLIGFFSSNRLHDPYKFFVFDYQSGIIGEILTIIPIVDLVRWESTPDGFPGEARCFTQ